MTTFPCEVILDIFYVLVFGMGDDLEFMIFMGTFTVSEFVSDVKTVLICNRKIISTFFFNFKGI